MFEDIQGKVDGLSKLKKLPASLTKEKFEEAKATLASAKDEWAKAQTSFAGGDFSTAVSMATVLKDKALKIMETLGMSAPEAAPAK